MSTFQLQPGGGSTSPFFSHLDSSTTTIFDSMKTKENTKFTKKISQTFSQSVSSLELA